MNNLRGNLLDSVEKFEEDKEEILRAIAEKRREELETKKKSKRKKKKVTFKLGSQDSRE